MKQRLAILLGDLSACDKDVVDLLHEWNEARVLAKVGWIDVSLTEKDKPISIDVATAGGVESLELYELVTSQVWDRITLIGLRSGVVDSYPEPYFLAESEIENSLRQAFSDNVHTVFRSATVSIADLKGLTPAAFDPRWDVHLMQEPVVRVDPAVAAQPMRTDHRAQLVLLLSMVVVGGFVWQDRPLLDSMEDAVWGDHKPLRIARAFLRVVDAGRLTDDVLSGAFPTSGPWSVPGDVPNARAVPPNTKVPESVIESIDRLGSFGFKPNQEKARPKGTKLGLLEGVKLFFTEFWGALAGIPQSMVATVRGEIESWVQKVTFGEDSTVVLKFDPLSPDFDLESVSAEIQLLGLTEELEAVGSSVPWEILQGISFSLVDGGRYPDGFAVPKAGVHRLVFTDPTAIGPAPNLEPFSLSVAERAVLALEQEEVVIHPVDVFSAEALHRRIEEAHQNKGLLQIPVGTNDANPDAVKTPPVVAIETEFDVPRSTKKKDSASGKRGLFGRRKKRITTPPSIVVTSASAEEDKPSDSIDTPDPQGLPETHEQEVDSLDTSIDRHLPGHPEFVPTEYAYVTSFYQGTVPERLSEFAEENRRFNLVREKGQLPNGNFARNKTCDHCGTRFDHGVLIKHEPSGELIHLGNVCAEKSYGKKSLSEFEKQTLEELDERWQRWLADQSRSLLWRVGRRMQRGVETAERTLSAAVDTLSRRPAAQDAQQKVATRFKKWTRRGVLCFVLLLAASIASVVLTPLPLLLFALLVASYFSGLMIRLAFLARDLVRARYHLSRIEDQYERAYSDGRHAVAEMLRLTSMNEQFMDWQVIIREIVHSPFGRGRSFVAESRKIADVRRPAGFILARSKPDDSQKMRPYLNARSQTMHAGWLSEIRDVIVSEWREKYQNSRLLSSGDNVIPESDNASSVSVVGRHPITNENVYYPRSDLRRRLISGHLQDRLIGEKAQQIADDLRKTPVGTLLGAVEVVGPGSALSGRPVGNFLTSLSEFLDQRIPFLADLISDSHPELRGVAPVQQLPPRMEETQIMGSVHVEPGVEFTAAAWVVELSPPISPLGAFRGMAVGIPDITNPNDESSTVV